MFTYEYINGTYGVIMLDKNKASKQDLEKNAARNIKLSEEHKEVALYFGKTSFSATVAKKINSIHNLGWF